MLYFWHKNKIDRLMLLSIMSEKEHLDENFIKI